MTGKARLFIERGGGEEAAMTLSSQEEERSGRNVP